MNSLTVWLTQHRAALRWALLRLRQAPQNTLLSIIAIGVALALPAGGQLLLQNGMQFARSATPLPQLSIYLEPAADKRMADEIRQALKSMDAVRSAEFIDREATLQRFKTAEGLREVIEALPRNPFPHAFIILPKDDSPRAMDELAATLGRLPHVEHVQLDSAWVRRLDALVRFGRSAVWVLATLLGIGLIAITFNVTRLQVLTQREEIEVSQLLGATTSFVRRPFLYLGSLLGLAGGMAAWLAMLLGGHWVKPPLEEIAQLYGVSLQFVGAGVAELCLLSLLSATLGWLGTALALRQYARTPAQ